MELASGERLPLLPSTPELYINRSHVIYGPSGSGKTVIIKGLMRILQPHIEQIVVFSPSEPSNRSYEGYVDPPLIHFQIGSGQPRSGRGRGRASSAGALEFLEKIWHRQEAATSVAKRANDPEALARLFHRIPDGERVEALARIEELNRRRHHTRERVKREAAGGACDERIREVDEKFRSILTLIYKKYITPHYETLFAKTHDDDERHCLMYLQFNPRMLIVFDDSGAELKPLNKKEILRKLFYQSRHASLTVIMALQDDTDLDANLRKNAYISFFTAATTATANFTRTANQFSKAHRATAEEAGLAVFATHGNKLAFIRDDPTKQHFYFTDLPPTRIFRFGSSALHELCDAARSDGRKMDADNPYYDKFAS